MPRKDEEYTDILVSARHGSPNRETPSPSPTRHVNGGMREEEFRQTMDQSRRMGRENEQGNQKQTERNPESNFVSVAEDNERHNISENKSKLDRDSYQTQLTPSKNNTIDMLGDQKGQVVYPIETAMNRTQNNFRKSYTTTFFKKGSRVSPKRDDRLAALQKYDFMKTQAMKTEEA